MWQNMQSKGKIIFLALILVVAGGLVAAALHEPELLQTAVEQPLDAKNFTQ